MKIVNSKQHPAGRGFKLILFIFLLPISYYLLPTASPALAQTEYKLLAPIPLKGAGQGDVETTTAVGYIQGIFTLIIAIAGGLAVIKIIFGGIKYMYTDAFTDKNEAKDTIQNAIWGLLLAMSAWLILYTVNPKLVDFNLIIPQQAVSGSTSPVGRSTQLSPGGPDNLILTHQQAIDAFTRVGVDVDGAPSLAGLRQATLAEIISLKSTCNCAVVVTSATGGSHSTRFACNHANGYKVDLRSQREGIALTNYIKKNYQPLPNRSDGAEQYRSPRGPLYALENNHWDVTPC